MTTRTVGSCSWILLVFALLLGACDEGGGPAAPDASAPKAEDSSFDPSGPEATTPVPGPVAFDQMLDVVSSDGCTLPGGPYARFVRRMAEPNSGAHALTSDAGFEPCNDAPEDGANSFTWSSEGGTFAWTATVPVGAVILQSGRASRVYSYGQRSWGDAGLQAPSDPMTGAPLPVDAVVVCHDYALLVAADVTGRLVARTDWTLEGVASGRSWDLFPGDRAAACISVQLTKAGPFNEPATAVGRVTIVNDTPLPARLTSVTNLFTGGYLIPIAFPVTLPHDLQPGEELVGTYSQPFPNQQTRTNTVTANTIGDVRGGTARTTLEFGERVAETPTATVVSSDGRSFGPFDNATSFLIEREFEASAADPAEVQVPWSVELLDDDGRFETTVTVRRHVPRLDVAVSTRFTRTWAWSLEHGFTTGASITDAKMLEGVPAWVRATTDGGTDSGFGTSGRFTVGNTHPSRVLEVSVLLVSVGANMEAPFGAEWSLDPDEERAGSFDLALPDGTQTEGALILRYNTRNFSHDGRSTLRGVTDATRALPLSFDEPSARIDAIARLGDSIAGDLGAVDAESGPAMVEYFVPLANVEPCGSTSVHGQARLLAADSSTAASVSYVIEVDIECGESVGCTRGRGYWRNHPEDPAWASAAQGFDTPLFDSGMTWMDALVRPVVGDPYRQLAVAWVTARLNQLAGADASVVAAALAEASGLLATRVPGSVAKSEAAQWRSLTSSLQDFNEGSIGPGACED
jgi:hypothetical protein